MRALGLCLLIATSMTWACGDDSGGNEGASGMQSAGRSGTGDERDGGEAGEGGASGANADGGSSGNGGFAGVAGLGGAGGQDLPDLGNDIGDPADPGAWTVFVYGHGDHNLSNTLVRDIVEMANAEISEQVRVIVLADFDSSQQIADSGETFPVGAEWLRVTGGGEAPESLGVEAELDLDDPNVLASSISAAFTQFPAEHYALILWDHGGSWSGGFGGDSQNGQRAGEPMSAPLVAQAIRAGLDDAQIERVELFSFDTCLMAGAEVALEMQDLTEVYIANAELDYGDGWDYDAFLTHLSTHLQDSAEDLATMEVGFWDAHHKQASPNDTLLRSHIALRAYELGLLAAAVDDFVAAWLASDTLTGTELGRAGYFSLPPYMNQLEDAQAEPELRDLGQFLRKMTAVSDPVVAAAAQTALDALGHAMLRRSQGELRAAAGQVGLHVELPLAASLTPELMSAYEQLAPQWVEASGWGNALAVYSALNDQLAPTITTSIANGTNPDIANLPTITFGSSDGDVAEVEVNLGTIDASLPDDLILFGVIAQGAIDAGASYEVAWNGQLTNLPDGLNGTQPIFVRTWENVDSDAAGMSLPPMLATFGLVDTSDGQQLLGALLFQDGDTETTLLTLLDPPVTLTLADVARDLPGTTFTPVLSTVSLLDESEAAVAGSPIPLDVSGLPLSFVPAAAGTYALLAVVTDVFGNFGGDAQLVEITTPIE